MRGARPFEALESLVASETAFEPGETVVVAASGGPDSTALAALVLRAARDAGAEVVLGHVNHELRPDAWQAEAVVLALATSLGVRALFSSLGPGPAAEARLREDRYAALVTLARRLGARRIFTAHHAEDQTETVLLALFRGAGPAGLRGMSARRPLAPDISLERPLLGVEPAELRAYNAAAHLPYALDPSNADQRYRRNAVRAALGVLRDSFPHLDAAVARCASILAEERAGLPRAALRAQLRRKLSEQAGDARDIGFERLDAAARALEAGSTGRHFLRRGVEMIVE